MRPKLVILGAGGHGRVLAEIVELSGEYQLIGFTDPDPKLKGATFSEAPVLGTDDLLPTLHNHGVKMAISGMGSVKDNDRRSRLFEKILHLGFQPAILRHPLAAISPRAEIGQGSVIMAQAAINPGAHIGENTIINSGAIIEHDCFVGDHTHVASHACLSGGVQVGSKTFIGAGATIIQNIRIGCGCLIGAGAVVVRDLPDQAIAMGVPAKMAGTRKESIC